MITKQKDIPAKERILKTAVDLFYRQGYQATGINEIIKKSGVAKATFYDHFPSKEDLGIAYLRNLHDQYSLHAEQSLAKARTPLQRFMTLVEDLEPWLLETKFKGCGFLNMVPEVANPTHPMRKEGMAHYETYRRLILKISTELIRSDKKRYGHLKAGKLANDYFLVVIGAIALCEVIHEIWPAREAVNTVRSLIA